MAAKQLSEEERHKELPPVFVPPGEASDPEVAERLSQLFGYESLWQDHGTYQPDAIHLRAALQRGDPTPLRILEWSFFWAIYQASKWWARQIGIRLTLTDSPS